MDDNVFDVYSPEVTVEACIFESFIDAIMAAVSLLGSAYSVFLENTELASLFLMMN